MLHKFKSYLDKLSLIIGHLLLGIIGMICAALLLISIIILPILLAKNSVDCGGDESKYFDNIQLSEYSLSKYLIAQLPCFIIGSCELFIIYSVVRTCVYYIKFRPIDHRIEIVKTNNCTYEVREKF
jgi:hypothetical protein